MKFDRVISGGQTGADRGGLQAAMSIGIKVGGWCPKGRRAEDGAIPAHYPLKETPSAEYPERTEWNVRDSDATIVFGWGVPLGRGSQLTANYCKKHQKPVLVIDIKKLDDVEASNRVIDFLKDARPSVLNIAGSRESKAPGIEAKVERVMISAFTHDWVEVDSRTPPEGGD